MPSKTIQDMDEMHQLQSMISSFRVADLQSLLAYVGKHKQGKKGELQARALELLQSTNPTFNKLLFSRKIRELYQTIQEETRQTSQTITIDKTQRTISNMNQGSSLIRPMAPPTSQPHQRMHTYAAYQQASPRLCQPGLTYPGQYTSQQQQLRPPLRPSVYNPVIMGRQQSKDMSAFQLINIKFSELPYFGCIEEIMKPTGLVCTGTPHSSRGSTVLESTFSITLSCNAANEIALNRDISKTPAIYPIQALLRFCTYDKDGVYDDFLPTGLSVRLNSKSVALPPCPPNTRSILEVRRAALPINLNPNLRLSPVTPNEIVINWVPELNKKFGFSISLVKCYKPHELLEKLKNNAVTPVEQTKLMISERLRVNDADDDIVATTNLRVSMYCPLGRTRLVYPAKGRNCNHLQCFDASTYITLNEKRTSWVCPVCTKVVPYRDLFLEQYFIDVLASSELTANCQEVQLLIDGSWKCYDEESENLTDDKDKETRVDSVEMILDDGEEAMSETGSTDENEDNDSRATKSGFIDLTDDDLVKIENEALPATFPSQTTDVSKSKEDCTNEPLTPNPGQAVSSSGYISPRDLSIISLDSPSPPDMN